METIEFNNVSYEFIKEILERYSFKEAIALVIQSNDEITIEIVRDVGTINTCKSIKVNGVRFSC